MALTKTVNVSVTVSAEEMKDALSKEEARAIATAKGLYVYDTPQGTPAEEFEWVKVADEYQTFTLAAQSNTRFGIDTRWVEKVLPPGTHRAERATYDNLDPARGAVKQVQVWRKKL